MPVEFQTVIGLEVHAQVLTSSKMFSHCPVPGPGSPPNTTVDPVSLGLPGSLPTVNRTAIERTIMTGLALNCEIPRHTRFDRKNYMYPDLMKGYQISQYELPLAVGGYLAFEHDGAEHRVGITRVHLEEDTARLAHVDANGASYSLVDVNRAGVPLMEIVSDPEIKSPSEARSYLIALRQILRYLGASSGNMDEGAFRVDANISQRSTDGSLIGPKVEVKNMNSFRSVERALEFEVDRQRRALAAGERLVQETRGWLEDSLITVSQRTKEFAEDYRYFPEPDLPPIEVDEAWVGSIRSAMVELPSERLRRFRRDYGLEANEAGLLTVEAEVADYFEEVVRHAPGQADEAAKWVTGELFALARTKGGFGQVAVGPDALAALITMVSAGEITLRTAKDVLVESATSGVAPRDVVGARGLGQVSDADLIADVARAVVREHEQAVADYRAGKQAAIGFLIGQAMRRLRGAGNPDIVRTELVRILESDFE
jgi:aspartyl-tRNA(Asn)/glutamyl-tRNA(Gln) amidotransferase subunit B